MNELIFSVCMLFQMSGDSIIGNATGFFYEYNNKIYLITNKHVVDFSKEVTDPSLIFNLHTDRNDLKKLKQFNLPLKDVNGFTWQHFTDEKIDVAAIQLEKSYFSECILRPITEMDFPPAEINIQIGDQLLAIGYPYGFTDNFTQIPIVKSCIVSTPLEYGFENYPLTIIDGDLHPGMSGSPIITKPSNILSFDDKLMFNPRPAFFFIGIHSATYYKVNDTIKEPVYEFKNGRIEITGFKTVEVKSSFGLQTCWHNGVIHELVASIDERNSKKN